jgi:hypothetical protein
MASKVRVKIGPVEIEYEGSEAFVKEDLPTLLAVAADLYKTSGLAEHTRSKSEGVTSAGSPAARKVTGTTATIAAKLKCSSGPDLIVAAAARLTLEEGLDSFSRQKIIDEMRSATAYYQKSYLNNLTKYLQTLLRAKKLVESAKDIYALSAEALKDIEGRLAV